MDIFVAIENSLVNRYLRETETIAAGFIQALPDQEREVVEKELKDKIEKITAMVSNDGELSIMGLVALLSTVHGVITAIKDESTIIKGSTLSPFKRG